MNFFLCFFYVNCSFLWQLFLIRCLFIKMQAELGRPNALQPDKGKVAIFVDCSPVAEPMFEVLYFYILPFLLSLPC